MRAAKALAKAGAGIATDDAGHAMAMANSKASVEVAAAHVLGPTTRMLVDLAGRVDARELNCGDVTLLGGIVLNAQINKSRCTRCKGRGCTVAIKTGKQKQCHACSGRGFLQLTGAAAKRKLEKLTHQEIKYHDWQKQFMPVFRDLIQEARAMELEGLIHIESRL